MKLQKQKKIIIAMAAAFVALVIVYFAVIVPLTAVIEDENGSFTVDASRSKLTVGETCEVCVRTERMRVSRTPVEGFNLPCTVREARYAGGSVETFCLMAGDSEAVATGEERMADAAKPGDTVYLHFNPAQAAVIGGASYGA